MIILFGSYARGGYVMWDQKIEFGIRTSYQSDLDILVVINKASSRIVESTIRNKVTPAYNDTFSHRLHPSVRFIVEHIKDINENLATSQYFFTEIVNDGIVLFDSEKLKLAEPRTLSFSEIKATAIREFKIHYSDGNHLLQFGSQCTEDKEKHRIGSFELHQSCEKFYNAISLVFTNYRPKNHKLDELGAAVKEFSQDLTNVFPQNTEFEKRCFDLIRRAYIEVRYNPDFEVTKEELEYMIQRTELLKEITNRICSEKIESYN